MNIELNLQRHLRKGVEELFGFTPGEDLLQLQQTRKEFEGDLTMVVFPLVKATRRSPADTATLIGRYLQDHAPEVAAFNVVKGFLNISLHDRVWLDVLLEAFIDNHYGLKSPGDDPELVMIEYSSPNTNKPLHLGHIRNNLLGFSLAEIMKGNGKKVVKT